MWKATFQNKLTIYRVNLPSYTHKIIKCRRHVVLRSQDWQKSTPKMAAWERLIWLIHKFHLIKIFWLQNRLTEFNRMLYPVLFQVSAHTPQEKYFHIANSTRTTSILLHSNFPWYDRVSLNLDLSFGAVSGQKKILKWPNIFWALTIVIWQCMGIKIRFEERQLWGSQTTLLIMY